MHGVNPIALQRRLLNIDDNAIDSLVTQYNNGINTNLSISMPDGIFLEGDRFTRLQKQINESYAGVKNSGKPLLLEGGLKAQPLGISNKDSQFLELYQFTQEQICKIFRVPPHMIGDLTHATFSNIEHQSIEFLNYCLTPYIKAFEEAAYSDLLNESEKETIQLHLIPPTLNVVTEPQDLLPTIPVFRTEFTQQMKSEQWKIWLLVRVEMFI